MIANSSWVEALVMRVQDNFLEWPAHCLTRPEAQQRFGVDDVTCDAVLDVLVEAKVLTRTAQGAYVRFFPRVTRAATQAPQAPSSVLDPERACRSNRMTIP